MDSNESRDEAKDEEDAVAYFEKLRWPSGALCTKCGSGNVVRGRQEKRRRQLLYCSDCHHMFSVTSGTILEATKLPLRKWVTAIGAVKRNPKISGRELLGLVDITPSAAWHMKKRILLAIAGDDVDIEIEPLTKYSPARGNGRSAFDHRKGERVGSREKKVELFGAEMTTKDLASIAGVSQGTVWNRMARGDSPEQAIARRRRDRRRRP